MGGKTLMGPAAASRVEALGGERGQVNRKGE